MPEQNGALIIISGPSGVGKSTVLNRAIRELQKVWFSVSATTRAPRAGEKDGEQYFFVSHDRFQQMIHEDELLEFMTYAGNYYGTPRRPVEEHVADGYIVIADVDVRGKVNICARYNGGVSVFIAPPSMEELERRLRGRGTETEEAIAKRLQAAEGEMAYMDGYDYVVVNDLVERAADELLKIIKNAAAAPTECEE